MRTQYQVRAAWLIEQYGGLWAFPEEYRQAHRQVEFWRSRGVRLADLPPAIRETERVYQAARHLERVRRRTKRDENV